MSLTISTVGNKHTLQVGGHTRDLPKEAMIEMLQLVLSHVAGSRDYTNVVSISKLFKVIELECEPDESDGEHEGEPAAPAPVAEKPQTPPQVEEPAKRPAARATRRPTAKKEDDE